MRKAQDTVLQAGSEGYGQSCECLPAKLILTHDPREELFLGVMHPAAALFEDYMDIDRLSAEHTAYRRALEQTGAKVLTVREVLLSGLDDPQQCSQLRQLADRFLTFDTSTLSTQAAAGQERYRQQILRTAAPADLVRIILEQPVIRLFTTPHNTGLRAEYVTNPLMNLFYTRDHLITTAKGAVVGRMNSSQREKGCEIMQFCLEKIGMPPLHRIAGEGAYLEGGDFYPFGQVAFIGCGMRTSQAAIEQLMDRDLLGCERLVVVKDRRLAQAEMHLDTYFNLIDRDLATLSAHRMTDDETSPDRLWADLYQRRPTGGYTLMERDIQFTELLRQLGVELIAIPREDADRMANNYLTVAPRRIVAVAGQSDRMCKILRDSGVAVTWVEMENLRKGYGAAHCMTQVLWRE